MPRPLLIASFVALALVSSCQPDHATATWPQGTVLTMDGQPILESEIDALAEPLAEVGPSYTLPHRRRVILTEVLIPRARARSLYGDAIPAARLKLETRRAAMESGADEPFPVEGNWKEIGMLSWLALRATPVGEWTPVFEGAGTVAQAKLIARDGNPNLAREQFECWLLWEHYADPEISTDPAELGGTLAIVAADEETWRAVVPTRWLFELKGQTQ